MGVFREVDLVAQDARERRVTVLALEWGGTKEHLVDQDSQSPPIYSTGVTAALDHFWCNVLFCSDERIRAEIGDT